MIPVDKPGGRPPLDRRNIIDGILWSLRTSAPWRDVPEEFGKWQSIWRLFDQWNGDETLDKILQNLQGEITINKELWCIDGTVIRAATMCGRWWKKGDPEEPQHHALGWSRGGFSTKLDAYLAGICRAKGAEAYRVGGTEDHVHIACTLPRTLTQSKLLEETKKA